MSVFHCSCGFAGDAEAEFRDHVLMVFSPADDVGTDGREHAEVVPDLAGLAAGVVRAHHCLCGFASDSAEEFDDHCLMVFVPAGSVGGDGVRHVPADVATREGYVIADDGPGGDGPG